MASLSERLYLLSSMLVAKTFAKVIERDAVSKILIFKMDDIGDLVYVSTFFTWIKTVLPVASITLVCKPSYQNLWLADPHIDRVLSMDNLKSETFDLICDMRGNMRTLAYVLRNRPRFFLEKGSIRWRNKGQLIHEWETNYLLLKPLLGERLAQFDQPQLYVSKTSVEEIGTFLKRNKIDAFACLHLGGNSVLRHWNVKRYAELATYLYEKYKLHIIVIGTKEEEYLYRNLQRELSFEVHNVCGLFTLNELMALFQKARIFVGNESGPLHIAAALNVDSIGLFGPGLPTVFYPMSDRSKVIHKILKCNPCDQVHCTLQSGDTCMDRIKVEEVKACVDDLLQSE